MQSKCSSRRDGADASASSQLSRIASFARSRQAPGRQTGEEGTQPAFAFLGLPHPCDFPENTTQACRDARLDLTFPWYFSTQSMARVFVGNLPEGVRERDLSEKFDVFGRVSSIRIKFPARPPPFAFIVRSYPPRGTQYRVAVSGLPDSMSWQDLKDFLRDGGDVVHSDVDRRGNGTASFVTPDEMRRAIRKLDGAELAGERVRIREEGAGGRS
ncbi:hypothetical protein BBJ28_00020933, partial [Nothophytophthora sp. Chile5]